MFLSPYEIVNELFLTCIDWKARYDRMTNGERLANFAKKRGVMNNLILILILLLSCNDNLNYKYSRSHTNNPGGSGDISPPGGDSRPPGDSDDQNDGVSTTSYTGFPLNQSKPIYQTGITEWVQV